MNHLVFGLCAGAVGCALALQFPATAIAGETVIFSFGNAAGEYPGAGLINVKGTLYGTALLGGAYTEGTVLAVNPKTGAGTALYSFCSQKNCTDGRNPYASLIDASGKLYGTTEQGGTYDLGTVFSVGPATGAETVLHSFGSGTDAAVAGTGLIEVGGTLYGTTYAGGQNCKNYGIPGCGTVFSVDPKSGAESVLYSFCSQKNCADGSEPSAGQIDANGTLYGTTSSGGAYGGGTVFAIDPGTGAETVLHTFGSGADGATPLAGLIDVKGMLYGTTADGGSNTNCGSGCGTVFSVNPATGAETVLYSFCGRQSCTDGAMPEASLIDVKGTLYSTTSFGGANCNRKYAGCGTVFSVDPSTGAESVLYSFCSRKKCADGSYPFASLVDVKGTLYGTTQYGGAGGGGTVFAVTP